MQPYGWQQICSPQSIAVDLQAPLTHLEMMQLPGLMMAWVVITPPWQSLSVTQAAQPAPVQYGAEGSHALAWTQLLLTQVSLVHGSLSSQSVLALHCTQSLTGSHTPSGHRTGLGVWVQPWAPQASSVQATLSLHSLASQQTAQPASAELLLQQWVPLGQPANWQTPLLHSGLVWHAPATQSAGDWHPAALLQPWFTSQ